MSTSETNILATDSIGNCWSYIKSDDKWNDITQLLHKEKEVRASENQNQSSIWNVCCSDTIHLAVAYNGT